MLERNLEFHNMKIRLLISSFLILLAGVSHAVSLTLERSAKNLDPFIESVSMCGRWKHNNEKGGFRIIYGYLWGHTEIYVQWVADPVWFPEKGKKERRVPLILYTATFPEYDDYEAAIDLENIKCIQRKDKWMITADADNTNEDDPEKSKYQLIIHLYNEPGKFRIEIKSKSKNTSKVNTANKRGNL